MVERSRAMDGSRMGTQRVRMMERERWRGGGGRGGGGRGRKEGGKEKSLGGCFRARTQAGEEGEGEQGSQASQTITRVGGEGSTG